MTLAQAKRELNRSAWLADSGVADQRTVDEAKDAVATATTRLAGAEAKAEGTKGPESRLASARIEEARAASMLAEARLAETVLYAPSDGVVLSRAVEPVQPGQILFRVSRDGALRLEADADEKNFSLLRRGLEAEVVADGYPDKPFLARLSWISPSVDQDRGTVKVRFDLENPVPDLRPDMTVSINLSV